MTITLEQEIKELESTLDERKREYPSLTRGPSPKLKSTEAEHRIACIESTLKRLRAELARTQGTQGSLFG